MNEDAPSNSRPPFQFPLRAAVVAFGVVGIALGFVGTQFQRYWSQRSAATRLQQFGGTVTWSPGGNVISVYLVGSPIQDADLDELRSFPALEVLFLSGTRITDDAVELLAEFDRLQFVAVSQTKMTPAGVAKLRRSLPGTTIVDIGIGNRKGAAREWIITGDE